MKIILRYQTWVKELIIPNSVKTIGNSAFYGCDSLTNIKVGVSVEKIGSNAFYRCTNLKNVYIEDLKSWCSIGFSDETSNPLYYAQHFFVNGEEIKELVIPDSIKYITEYAFYGFNGFSSVYLPNTLDKIEPFAFGGTEYNIYCYPKPYCMIRNFLEYKSRALLYGAPVYTIGEYWTTQTTIKIHMQPLPFTPDPDGEKLVATPYFCLLNGEETLLDHNGFGIIKDLYPGQRIEIYPYTRYSDGTTVKFDPTSITTKDLTINLSATSSPTTIKWNCYVYAGDATVKSLTIKSNGCSVNDSNVLLLTGLEPEKSYTCNVEVTCKEGVSYKTMTMNTTKLNLETLKPKSVSSTCAIVAAKTNIDEVESGVGFQWKKYEAPVSLDPNESYAAIYNGQIEGYIKNLQPTYYNVRAFYKSANDNYYYGEWVTFDQTDFSYFEPTIRTYEAIDVGSNSAKVKAYVLAGTDEIIEQGFEYWPTSSSQNKAIRMQVAPLDNNNVNTVLGTGQIMIVTLTDLQPSSSYSFRSFVKTAYGTTYGEEKSLITESDPTGIESLYSDTTAKTVLRYYDLEGRRLNKLRKGMNIIHYSDGTVRKVMIK